MTISINWGTKVVSVPQADLTNLGGGVYELDINVFRLRLKDLEDDEAGIPFTKTHNHNTIVTVAGVTLARVIEIINGYTVTFEDGQYAVNLVGANSNISDVTNINQVSIRSSNTAGLIQVTAGSGVLPQDIIDIADAVWDETLSGHTAGGTSGKKLTDVALEATSTSIKSKTDNLPSDPMGVADIANIQTNIDNLQTNYTAIRAAKIDNLDIAISSRASAQDILLTPANKIATDTSGRVDLSKVLGSDITTLVDGKLNTYVSNIGDNTIKSTTFDSSVDTYQAKVWFSKNADEDKYVAVFFKNGQPITSGIINPCIRVVNIDTATVLLNYEVLEEVGSFGFYKYNTEETNEHIVYGISYMIEVVATINNSQRTWYQPIGRDN